MNIKKKKTIVSLILIIISFLILVIVFPLFRIPSAKEIYSHAMNNVVEVKAQSGENFVSYGTAELISLDGEFITNTHVVTFTQMGVTNQFVEYFVRFSSETEYREVELIKYDILLDLAVLKLKQLSSLKLKPIKFGDNKKIKSGDSIYAIGNSQNFGISISQGIVGIPLIEIEYAEQKRKVIQCDITIAEGNSGGALLDNKGRLVGITTFRTKDKLGNVIYGIAYSIPINIVLDYINS